MSEIQAKADFMARSAQSVYETTGERAALRCALGDAAALCDAIAREIETTGRDSKRRRELHDLAKRCGDAIDAMRDLISVPRPATTENG